MELDTKAMGAARRGPVKRHILIPKNIYIIGAGGVTSYFMPVFVKTLAHVAKEHPRIYIVDGDKLEARNLERQLFDGTLVDENKAEALRKQYIGQYRWITAVPKYFALGARVKKDSLIFGFVDNHAARRAVLAACDSYNCMAIIGANEYTDAQAIWYSPDMKDGPLDPRVRYPEILQDTSGDPMRPLGCNTEEALEAAPQLAIANNSCACYALQMFWFYFFKKPELDEASRKHWPVEHTNNFGKIATRTEEFYGSRAA